jgi:hypothetical protein
VRIHLRQAMVVPVQEPLLQKRPRAARGVWCGIGQRFRDRKVFFEGDFGRHDIFCEARSCRHVGGAESGPGAKIARSTPLRFMLSSPEMMSWKRALADGQVGRNTNIRRKP